MRLSPSGNPLYIYWISCLSRSPIFSITLFIYPFSLGFPKFSSSSPASLTQLSSCKTEGVSGGGGVTVFFKPAVFNSAMIYLSVPLRVLCFATLTKFCSDFMGALSP